MDSKRFSLLDKIILLIVVIGLLVFYGLEITHRVAVGRCKTLRLGMTEQEVIASMKFVPSWRNIEDRHESLNFYPAWIVSSVQDTGISVGIDRTTGRAIFIICNEFYSLSVNKKK